MVDREPFKKLSFAGRMYYDRAGLTEGRYEEYLVDSLEATSEPSKSKNVGIGHRGNTCMCLPGVC